MPSISVPAAIAIGAGVSAAGGIAASEISSSAASKSAKDASNLNVRLQNENVSRESPFIATGYNASNQLNALNASGFTAGQPNYLDIAAANTPNANTMAGLEQTPGYQFTRDQGLQATQNAAAARGLGVSGAALKGAATYATGLADSTYQNRFNEQQQKFTDYLNLNTGQQANAQNVYSRLAGTASIGQNAAAGTGSNGATAGAYAGNYLNQAGLANAAGDVGAGKAFSGNINSGLNNYLQYIGQQSGIYPPSSANFARAANNSPFNTDGTLGSFSGFSQQY